MPRVAAGVSDQAAGADVHELQTEPVLLLCARRPPTVLHTALGVIAQEPKVPEAVGAEVQAEVLSGAGETRRRGHRPGSHVVDGDPLPPVLGAGVAHGEGAPWAGRVEVGGGVGQPEPVDDRPLDNLGVAAARRLLDDPAEQRVGDVGVVEAVIGGVGRLASLHECEQLVGVGEGVLELPVVAIRAIAGHPRAVVEEVGDGAAAEPGQPGGRGRQVPNQRVVQAERRRVRLGELEDRRCRERLRVRGDVEGVSSAEYLAGAHVRHPVGARRHDGPLMGDRELHPGDPEGALAVPEPSAGPRRHVLDKPSGHRHGGSVPSRPSDPVRTRT